MSMIDKQIKQNAIKTAADFKDWHHPQMSFYYGYIADAHSRDEEIEQLGKDYHDMFLTLANKIEQLRKSWTNIVERLS